MDENLPGGLPAIEERTVRLVLVDNILLDTSGQLHQFTLHPHLGLISLVAVARAHGHEALLYDPKLQLFSGELQLAAGLYDACACAILELGPDAVGFTTLGCNFICTAQIARQVKRRRPAMPVLLGGPHATIMHREIMRAFPVFDCIVRGEAEDLLPELLGRVPGGRMDDLPGVTWRDGGQVVENAGTGKVVDLDGLPVPAFDAYPIESLGLTSLRVEAGRGCPFACTFCSTAPFFGRLYRLKQAQRLVAELDLLNLRYGLTRFSLTHDLFTVNKKKVAEFCDAVADRGYTWDCSARADCVDDALLARMARAGCRAIYFGIETGSRRMQKVVQKKLDLDLVAPMVARCIELGMAPTASFITGFPDEETADQDDTLDMIGELVLAHRARVDPQLHLLTPEPGTEIVMRHGAGLAYDGHIADFNFPPIEPDDVAIITAHPDVFMIHHYLPTNIPRATNIFVAEAFRALQDLGNGVLAHLLGFFGGRLSRLIRRMQAWATAQGRAGDRDRRAVVREFLAHVLGAEHHALSLVRCMYAARDALVPDGGADDAAELSLAPGVRVLDRLHDCNVLLQALATGDAEVAALPAAARTETWPFALKLAEGASQARLSFELYRLSPAARVVLGLVGGGTTTERLEQQTASLGLPPGRVDELCDELAEAGVLRSPAPELRGAAVWRGRSE